MFIYKGILGDKMTLGGSQNSKWNCTFEGPSRGGNVYICRSKKKKVYLQMGEEEEIEVRQMQK